MTNFGQIRMKELGAELKAVEKEKKDIEEFVDDMSTKFEKVVDMHVSRIIAPRASWVKIPFSKRRTSCGTRRDLIRSRGISRRFWRGWERKTRRRGKINSLTNLKQTWIVKPVNLRFYSVLITNNKIVHSFHVTLVRFIHEFCSCSTKSGVKVVGHGLLNASHHIDTERKGQRVNVLLASRVSWNEKWHLTDNIVFIKSCYGRFQFQIPSRVCL